MGNQAQHARARTNRDISFWFVNLSIWTSIFVSWALHSRNSSKSDQPSSSESTRTGVAPSVITAMHPSLASGSVPDQAQWAPNLVQMHCPQSCCPHGLASLVSFCAVGLWALRAMYQHPRWYAQSGRTKLLAAARLTPRVVALAELLLRPSPCMAQARVHAAITPCKGGLALLVTAIALPVSPPVRPRPLA
jgi:hypothetical protein